MRAAVKKETDSVLHWVCI